MKEALKRREAMAALGYGVAYSAAGEAYSHANGSAVEESLWGAADWVGWRDWDDLAEEPITGDDPVAIAKKLLEQADD